MYNIHREKHRQREYGDVGIRRRERVLGCRYKKERKTER